MLSVFGGDLVSTTKHTNNQSAKRSITCDSSEKIRPIFEIPSNIIFLVILKQHLTASFPHAFANFYGFFFVSFLACVHMCIWFGPLSIRNQRLLFFNLIRWSNLVGLDVAINLIRRIWFNCVYGWLLMLLRSDVVFALRLTFARCG